MLSFYWEKTNTGKIGLENIGVVLDDQGFIKINNKCQTNIEHVYAIGIVLVVTSLLIKLVMKQKIAAEVIDGQNSVIDFQAMPLLSSAIVAYTGLTEKEAKEKGYETVSSRFPFKQMLGRYLSRMQMALYKL